MTLSISFAPTSADAPDSSPLGPSYRVHIREGCHLIFGAIPATDLALFSGRKGLYIDTEISSHIGATLVLGRPADLDRLRKLKPELPISATRQAWGDQAQRAGLPPAVIEWLRTGRHGQSSLAICRTIFGHPNDGAIADLRAYPRDADDFGRCLDFVWRTGCAHLLDRMSAVSPEWRRIVKAWPEMVGRSAETPRDPDGQLRPRGRAAQALSDRLAAVIAANDEEGQ